MDLAGIFYFRWVFACCRNSHCKLICYIGVLPMSNKSHQVIATINNILKNTCEWVHFY